MIGPSQITIRDATEADVPALTAIKQPEVLHKDRLQEAKGSGFRYLVLLCGPELIGFACLVFRRPASWSDANDRQHLPQIVDLQVVAEQRGRGYGSAFLRAIEQETVQAGYKRLYLAVEPEANARAYALYRRLGYQPLQREPYLKRWEFTDSCGGKHQGQQWVVDMVKSL